MVSRRDTFRAATPVRPSRGSSSILIVPLVDRDATSRTPVKSIIQAIIFGVSAQRRSLARSVPRSFPASSKSQWNHL